MVSEAHKFQRGIWVTLLFTLLVLLLALFFSVRFPIILFFFFLPPNLINRLLKILHWSNNYLVGVIVALSEGHVEVSGSLRCEIKETILINVDNISVKEFSIDTNSSIIIFR